MNNPYDRNRYGYRTQSPSWERARDEDPNEERNMWQAREERDDGARRDGGANRFERGNERRYPDSAYGLSGSASRDYAHGFGPNHGFGYPSRGPSQYSPTGLDRDRLRARGEQGYGREFGGYAGRGPKDYKRSAERIREDICERLSRDDEVDASEITVRVESGEVTLEGSVETRRQKHRAEEIAAEVLGVDDVHNSVRVRKSILSELKDKVTGDQPPTRGHAGSGTKTTAGSGDYNRH